MRGSGLIASAFLVATFAGAANGQAAARLARPTEALDAAPFETASGAGLIARPAEPIHRAVLRSQDAPFQSAPDSSATHFDTAPTAPAPLGAAATGAGPEDEVLLGASTGGVSPVGGWAETDKPAADRVRASAPRPNNRPASMRTPKPALDVPASVL